MESFNGMVLGRSYDSIRVADIIDEAGVGRSTFYEHFRGKEALLKHAMSGLLGVLADAATDAGDGKRLAHVLEHFRENRRAARARFSGPSASQVVRWLAELIEARLSSMCRAKGVELIIPVRLAAAQAAEAQVGLIRAWLEEAGPGSTRCSAATLATALQRTVNSAASSLIADGSRERGLER